jgi:flagellar protein FliL
MYTMPGFVVNLAGSPRRLMKVEMTFEMLDKDGFEEIVRNSPSARDAIVRILNRKTFDDVETIQGKLFLKDQISVALNQAMKAGVVKDIYFNEFLVQ